MIQKKKDEAKKPVSPKKSIKISKVEEKQKSTNKLDKATKKSQKAIQEYKHAQNDHD